MSPHPAPCPLCCGDVQCSLTVLPLTALRRAGDQNSASFLCGLIQSRYSKMEVFERHLPTKALFLMQVTRTGWSKQSGCPAWSWQHLQPVSPSDWDPSSASPCSLEADSTYLRSRGESDRYTVEHGWFWNSGSPGDAQAWSFL